jgi:hypothetical protein
MIAAGDAMKTGIMACLIASLGLFLTMGIVQKFYGLGNFRFGIDTRYDAASLQQKIRAEPGKAALVVFPLVFPLDLLFLTLFAAFVALCSLLGPLAPASRRRRSGPFWSCLLATWSATLARMPCSAGCLRPRSASRRLGLKSPKRSPT